MRNYSGCENRQKAISTIGIKTAGGSFYPIVEENSGKEKRVILNTAIDNQRRVRISLYRSASGGMDSALHVGDLVVDGITPRPKGQNSIELIISSTEDGNIIAAAKDTDASRPESRRMFKVSLAPFNEEKAETAADFLPEYSDVPPGLYESPKEKKPWQVLFPGVIAAVLCGLAFMLIFVGKTAADDSGKFPFLPENLSHTLSLPVTVETADIQLPIAAENPVPVTIEISAQDAAEIENAETDLVLPSAMMTGLPLEVSDLILSSYRDPALRDWTLDFFCELTGSYDVASEVLAGADAYGVNPALAFSLCAEESSYNPDAINNGNRNGTIDRGLFQLNSATFSTLKINDFYDPGINADNGISHLAWCLEYAGSEGAALAVYNTGSTRVNSGETSKTTLDYITRILNRKHKIEDQFMVEYIRASLTRACLIIDTGNQDR